MREAIASCEVGDDVIDMDPTVEALQDYTAEVLGKETSLFMPSGSMTNQIAVRVHCKPGDEFICEAGCHIYNYEQAAFAQLSGVVAKTVEGEHSVLHVDQLKGLIRPRNEHLVRTRMVCLENTHNRGGGRVQPYENVTAITQWARDNGLRTHLDGARLFNAVAASGIDARQWASHFDTVSVCFSKGLGAPVGSALAGPKDLILEARRHRKLFGGGMRQAGVIAAGALFGMQHYRQRLAEDHANARILADAVDAVEGLHLRQDKVETNIIIFTVDPSISTPAEFAGSLEKRGVRCLAIGQYDVRMVTHLDVSAEQAEQAAEIMKATAADLASGRLVASNPGTQY